MKKILALLVSTASFGAHAEMYVGFGYGESDYSKLTSRDTEFDSLTITKINQKPNAFSVFMGERSDKYISHELTYVNLGEEELSGYLTSGGNTATALGRKTTQGLGLSLMAHYDINKISPYIRAGLMYLHTKSDTTINDPTKIFQNPNNSTATEMSVRPMYGYGVSYDIGNNVKARIDHMIVDGAFVDYIDNINNSYIERDASITTVSILYQLDGNGKKAAQADGKWSIGISGGSSSTDARMTNGRYSGNIWNLRTHTISTSSATGDMTDDKSGTSYRYSLYNNINQYEYELYVANLGEYKSRSSNLGITGGGNALTGSAQRTAMAYGVSMGYNIKVSDKLSLIPKIGLSLVDTRDEIYNNLDFSGVGGSERGPVINKMTVSPTIGLGAGYSIGDNIEIRVAVDHFNDIGSDSALGKGSVNTITAGLKMRI